MTPEQLEAHRARFEQRYAHIHGWQAHSVTARRDGDRYTLLALETAWQLYQWALVDAQRAVSEVQGGEPPKWIDDPHDIEQGRMLNPAWLSLHGLTAKEASIAIQPPQQSAQPVAVSDLDALFSKITPLPWFVAADFRGIGLAGDRWTVGGAFSNVAKDSVCRHGGSPENNLRFMAALANAWPAIRSMIAAAQPVEVQRVPLTDEFLRANGVMVHGDGNVFFTNVQQLNRVLGIKPTSSEGGESC